MTPRQLHALRKRDEQHRRWADALNAMVCCTIYNVNRGRRDRARGLRDFMLDPGPRPRQSWQQQLAMARQITAALGGAVKARS